MDDRPAGAPRPLPMAREVPPPPPPYDPAATSPWEPSPPAPPPQPVSRPLRVDPAAYRELEAVYREVDRRIAALGPRCDRRGLCCDFDRTDHVLFASFLEVSYVKDHIARERFERPTGNVCPLLEEGLCSAREVRMIGCRTYYCQEGYEPFGADVYEWALAEVRRITKAYAMPWRYAPALDGMRDGS